MLERVEIPGQELYDGLETGLHERAFALPVGDVSFSVADLDGSGLAGLRARIGDAAFEQVVADAGIQRRHGSYKDAGGLSPDFLIRGGHLFVLGIGEVSYGRYRLALHGAWRMG